MGAAQGGPAGLRALEGSQARRGRRLAVALGRGAARLAYRVLGDGREAARRGLRDPRRGLGPRLSPPRERDRPNGVGPRTPAGQDLDAQRDGAHRPRGEDGEVGRQRVHARRGDRALRPRGGDRLPDLGALPAAARVRRGTRSSRRAARNERLRDFFRGVDRVDGPEDPVVAETREAFLSALADDFNTPRAMAALYELVAEGHRRPVPGAHEGARATARDRRARVAGAQPRRRSTPRRRSCSPSASGREPSATSSAPTGSATSSTSAGGRCATRGEGCETGGARGEARDRLRATPGRRGKAWTPPGAARWTMADAETEELTRLAGSPDHQGFVAEVDPYPYADPEALLEGSRRVAGRPRPGAGSAQPRRGLPLGRGGRGDRRGDTRAALGDGHAGRLQGLPPERWSTSGWRA